MKDYVLRVRWLDEAQPLTFGVCATDAIDAHSELWQKLPENRLNMVDTSQIFTITACQHKKGVIV